MDDVHPAADGGLTFPTYADREAGGRLVEATIGGDAEPADGSAPTGSMEPADDRHGGTQHQTTP